MINSLALRLVGMDILNPRIPLGKWVEDLFNWLQAHVQWLFDFITTVTEGLFAGLNYVLATPPYWIMIIIFAAVAWAAGGLKRGWKLAIYTVIAFYLIRAFNMWPDGMATVAMVLVAVVLALVIAIPVGILAARNRCVSSVVRPILDLMQTMPGLAYLVPAMIVFGIGATPGLVCTLIFAMPPGIRLTELAIRQVDVEVVEAGQAFGSSPGRILRQIQIPLAMPTIMAGVNQVIMLALSMVVIAGFAGADGLGKPINDALQNLDLALGAEAGVSVVLIAVFLDRVTATLGNRGRAG